MHKVMAMAFSVMASDHKENEITKSNQETHVTVSLMRYARGIKSSEGKEIAYLRLAFHEHMPQCLQSRDDIEPGG